MAREYREYNFPFKKRFGSINVHKGVPELGCGLMLAIWRSCYSQKDVGCIAYQVEENVY